MEDKGPVNLVFYEWKKIAKDLKQPDLKFTDKLKYLFYSPGWRHDGTGKTVRDYQREELERRMKKQAS